MTQEITIDEIINLLAPINKKDFPHLYTWGDGEKFICGFDKPLCEAAPRIAAKAIELDALYKLQTEAWIKAEDDWAKEVVKNQRLQTMLDALNGNMKSMQQLNETLLKRLQKYETKT